MLFSGEITIVILMLLVSFNASWHHHYVSVLLLRRYFAVECPMPIYLVFSSGISSTL